jgi:hypothetical protein
MSTDPLEALIVDEEAVARQVLADVLAPYVGIARSGDLVLTDAAARLTTADRLLAVLLATQAAHLLGVRSQAGATPTGLVALSGLPAGTVRPKLSELAKRRLVVKEGPNYVVPLPVIRIAASILQSAQGASSRRRAS